jgi:uncharacterized membrane-anchored protein
MDIELRDEQALSAHASPTAALPGAMDITHGYWVTMLICSACGTNLGDLWAEVLVPGLGASLASMLAISAVAVWYHRRTAIRTEAGYWVAIVSMRAAATNIADLMTHELRLGYVAVSVLLFGAALLAARFTTPGSARLGSPRVDGAYWATMFIAGVFGTAAGDLIDHTIGLSVAAVVLCLVLVGLVVMRAARLVASMAVFWLIVMVERCAGTALGDMLASKQGIDLGIVTASVCTGSVTIMALWLRGRRPAR